MRYRQTRLRLLLLVWAVVLGTAALATRAALRPARSALPPPATATGDLLSRIRQTGVLRVGTTGDYDPFSYVDSSGSDRGIDIEALGCSPGRSGQTSGSGSCRPPGRR
jgi:ABC-type amino acid transport substrate-binding protein